MRFRELFLLNGFAIAQPTFALLAAYPEFLSFRSIEWTDVALLALLVCTAIPIAAALAGAAVRLVSARAAALVSGAFLAVLAALAMLPVLAGLGLPGDFAGLAAIAAGIALATGIERWTALASAVRFVSPLALVFPVWFAMSDAIPEEMAIERPLALRGPAGEFRGPRIPSDVPVVVLVFDELPLTSIMTASGQLDASRMPRFAALAEESTWYRNARSTWTHTPRAVGSLLQGFRIEPRGGSTYRSEPRSLFRLLENGNGVIAYETMTALCPPTLSATGETNPGVRSRVARLVSDVAILYAHRVTPPRWSAALPAISGRWSDFAARDEEVVGDDPSMPPEHRDAWRRLGGRIATGLDSMQRGLVELHSGARPTLFYLHITFPHFPWQYFPSGRAYQPADRLVRGPGDLRSEQEWDVVQAQQRHLLQVGYADVLLGLLIDELREVGWYDDALVIVTSDHGTAFEPGVDHRTLHKQNFAEVFSIPLLVKLPGQSEPGIDDCTVELIDILPTIAEVLDIDVPWEIEGRSLHSSCESRPPLPYEPAWRRDPASFFAQRQRALERNRNRFEPGWQGVFDVAPEPGQRALLGQAVEDLPVESTASTLRVEIADLAAFSTVEATGKLPNHLRGHIREGANAGPIDLAIAVDGRIAAVTRSYRSVKGPSRFTALLPEASIREGANSITLYELAPLGETYRLVPVRIGAAD